MSSLSSFHYMLRRDLEAPAAAREELIDQALRIAPNDFTAHMVKAQFLMERREWKKEWEFSSSAIATSSERERERPGFPMHLIHIALLSLIQGPEWEPWFTWAQEVAPKDTWVRAAGKLFTLETKEQQVERAKDLLSMEADSEGQSFDEWLGTVPVMQPMVPQDEELPDEEPEEERETYSPSRIEQMGPVMREKIIIGLLVKATRMGE